MDVRTNLELIYKLRYIQMHIDNDIIGGHHLHYDLMPSSTNVITCR